MFNACQKYKGTNSSLSEAVKMFEVWSVRLCLKETGNEPCQHTNCNAGFVKPSLREDAAQPIPQDWRDSLHVWPTIPLK